MAAESWPYRLDLGHFYEHRHGSHIRTDDNENAVCLVAFSPGGLCPGYQLRYGLFLVRVLYQLVDKVHSAKIWRIRNSPKGHSVLPGINLG